MKIENNNEPWRISLIQLIERWEGILLSIKNPPLELFEKGLFWIVDTSVVKTEYVVHSKYRDYTANVVEKIQEFVAQCREVEYINKVVNAIISENHYINDTLSINKDKLSALTINSDWHIVSFFNKNQLYGFVEKIVQELYVSKKISQNKWQENYVVNNEFTARYSSREKILYVNEIEISLKKRNKICEALNIFLYTLDPHEEISYDEIEENLDENYWNTTWRENEKVKKMNKNYYNAFDHLNKSIKLATGTKETLFMASLKSVQLNPVLSIKIQS